MKGRARRRSRLTIETIFATAITKRLASTGPSGRVGHRDLHPVPAGVKDAEVRCDRAWVAEARCGCAGGSTQDSHDMAIYWSDCVRNGRSLRSSLLAGNADEGTRARRMATGIRKLTAIADRPVHCLLCRCRAVRTHSAVHSALYQTVAATFALSRRVIVAGVKIMQRLRPS